MVATRQRLRRVDVRLHHRAGAHLEQVEGADDLAAQPHGQRVHRTEAGTERLGGEPGPTMAVGGQIDFEDRLTGVVAVETRALAGLQFEQLQPAHRLAGGGHHPQITVGTDQHEPGGPDSQHLDATVGEQGQQLHDVEVRDERVGQLHERRGQQRLSGRRISHRNWDRLAGPS